MAIRVCDDVMICLSRLNKHSQNAEFGHTMNKRIAICADGIGGPPVTDDDTQKYIGSIVVGSD